MEDHGYVVSCEGLVNDTCHAFAIRGLEEGYTYHIHEEALEGYCEPAYFLNKEVMETGKIGSGGLIVNGKDSFSLPESGGRGTSACKIMGTCLALLASIILLGKRK